MSSSKDHQENATHNEATRNLERRRRDLMSEKDELLSKVAIELAKNESMKDQFNLIKRMDPGLATDPRTETLRRNLNHPLFSVFKNCQ